MADSQNSSPKIFEQRRALCLGVALLLGYALITAFTVYDKSRRTSLEQVTSPTAVGDNAFFPLPQPFDTGKPFDKFEGHALYFVDWKNAEDIRMIKAGADDSKAFAIYKFARARGDDASFFYLKIKQGLYVQAKRQ